MADDNNSAASGSPSKFYPFATSPDVIRSHEKDAYLTSTLASQAQSIARSLRGARFAHTHSEAIKHLTELLYLSLTTVLGNRTLGEEYCDIVQLEDDTLKLPSIIRRTGYVTSSVLAPWALQWILPSLRQKLRAKLQRSVARLEAKAALTSSPTKSKTLRFQSYVLKHLDSLTSLSPIYALSLATFYFTGSYYHISKRLWGLRYVFTKKIGESEQRIGYEVLGVLLVLQMAVQSVIHVRDTVLAAERGGGDSEAEGLKAKEEGVPLLSTVQNPPDIAHLPLDAARYDLDSDPTALTWIPEGQQRKCTLCLEAFKDPSVTTCGHVFCWTCIRDWVREKPECPLCRQGVMASKILPLRG